MLVIWGLCLIGKPRMKNASLSELIKSKWFDDYQNGLESRFSANGMTYTYHYEKNDWVNSVVVFLGKNKIETRIELLENGDLNFSYTKNDRLEKERFIKCSEDDFHTMLAHAFIYIWDGNFDYDKDWHSNLNERKKE